MSSLRTASVIIIIVITLFLLLKNNKNTINYEFEREAIYKNSPNNHRSILNENLY